LSKEDVVVSPCGDGIQRTQKSEAELIEMKNDLAIAKAALDEILAKFAEQRERTMQAHDRAEAAHNRVKKLYADTSRPNALKKKAETIEEAEAMKAQIEAANARLEKHGEDQEKVSDLIAEAQEELLKLRSLDRQVEIAMERVARAKREYEDNAWRFEPMPLPQRGVQKNGETTVDPNRTLFDSALARRHSEK